MKSKPKVTKVDPKNTKNWPIYVLQIFFWENLGGTTQSSIKIYQQTVCLKFGCCCMLLGKNEFVFFITFYYYNPLKILGSGHEQPMILSIIEARSHRIAENQEYHNQDLLGLDRFVKSGSLRLSKFPECLCFCSRCCTANTASTLVYIV